MITKLSTLFSMKDLGLLDYFLGVQVIKTYSGLLLCQTKYIKELLCKANMQFARSSSTPMNNSLQLTAYGSDTMFDAQLYRCIVGGLQYVTVTRPELAFSVNMAC